MLVALSIKFTISIHVHAAVYLVSWGGIGLPDVTDPNQYTLYGNTPPSYTTNNVLCAIQATSVGGLPDIDCGLIAQIANALQRKMEYPNILLKA